MSTALKTDEEKKEHFDTEEELDHKATILADLVKTSKHFVAFTGAGISTSAGVPDFRSGLNTVLPTGPGAWERAATKTSRVPDLRQCIVSAIPSPTHMALLRLHEAGYLKFLISQNTDGLHRKSGFPHKCLAELHGNSNLEVCKNAGCKKQYMRDFRVRTNTDVHQHETTRKCENCGGPLYDTIVNFGENLPKSELTNGFDHSEKADLCLVLGSSLRVTPAADMPRTTAKRGGKLVIVNLQATPLDKYALRINSFIDDVMIRLMKKLDLEIPKFTLKRRVAIARVNDGKDLVVRGVDSSGTPYTLLTGVDAKLDTTDEKFKASGSDPYKICFKTERFVEGTLSLELKFQGHYGEPALKFDVPLHSLNDKNESVCYIMEFDPQQKSWINCFAT